MESAPNWYRDVAWRAKLGAFGWDGIAVQLISNIEIGFPGQYRDWESGWWHNGYRSYSSLKGGYEQSDPSGLAGGVNTYAYAGASPTMNVDPEGLQFFPYSRNLNKRDGHQIPDGVAQRLNVVWGIGTAGAAASVYSPVITAGGLAGVRACQSEPVRNAVIEACIALLSCFGSSPNNPPTAQRHEDHTTTQQVGQNSRREARNVWKVIFPGR